MSNEVLTEIRDLLVDIRDLLLPVADAHRADYERRNAVRALLSTEKRRAAWMLADGTRTQIQIATGANLAKGATSSLFSALEELGAIVDDPHPKRTMDV